MIYSLADLLPVYEKAVSSYLRFQPSLGMKVEYGEGQGKSQFKIKERVNPDYWIVS